MNTSLEELRGYFKAHEETRRRARVVWLLLAGLLLAHLLANLWWLQADHHAIRTDEQGHMDFARQYHEVLFVNDYANFIERGIALGEIVPGNPAHPPLLHLLGALAIQCFGYSMDVLALVGTVLFLLTLLGCYGIMRPLLSPWQAFYAVTIVSLTPVVFCASRYFMLDYLAMTLTVWIILALLRSDHFFNTYWVFLFAVLHGLGFLCRANTFLYYLIPLGVILVLGLRRAYRIQQTDRTWGSWGQYGFNLFMTLVVSVGIFSPWYFHHGERFYQFWRYEHLSGPGGPLAALDEAPPAEQVPRVEVRQASLWSVPALAAEQAAPLRQRLVRPEVPWHTYAVYLINDNVFLVLFLLGLAGLPLAVYLRQYRSLASVLLVLWVLGAYALMTLLFKNSTPRYMVEVAPAFGLLAALAVLAIPWKIPRWIAAILLVVVLLFQYGNLTFHHYGPVSRATIPVKVNLIDNPEIRYSDRLVVYKEELSLGFSYGRLAAPEADNYLSRVFRHLVETEKAAGEQPGAYAGYLALNLRSTEFHDRHYWRDDIYQRHDLESESLPERRLKCLAYGKTLPEIAPGMPNAAYIVYGVDGDAQDDETQWQMYLQGQGFELVERFSAPQLGSMSERHYGILARRTAATALSLEEVNTFTLFELQELLQQPGLAAVLREHAQTRFDEALALCDPVALNAHVDFYDQRFEAAGPHWCDMALLFRCAQPIPKDYRLYVLVQPEVEDVATLPEAYRDTGYRAWRFSPLLPTREWEAGTYQVLKHRIALPPIPCRIVAGFFRGDDERFGDSIDLGRVHFEVNP